MSGPDDAVAKENARLREQLDEAEALVRAISQGEVDAFLVRHGAEEQVLVLDGVDKPYRLMIERMHQGAITLASDATVIYANRRLAEMLGRPGSEVLGAALQDFIAPEDRARVAELLERAHQGDSEVEVAFARADGKPLPVHLAATPLVEHEGILCLIATDLTLMKKHDDERAARIAAEASADALRAADHRKDEFLAMLAHELRGPLAPLRNCILSLDRFDPKAPEMQATRAMMERQVEALIRLVDDLLDVGRVTQGKIEMRRTLVDLRSVVARAVESVRGQLEERGHAFELKSGGEPIPVEVDELRIAQAIANLLNNAAKFTPGPGKIGLEVALDGFGAAVVRVRDNGIGIAPPDLRKIFELFAQVNPTANRSQGGLGIGLTLARQLVEMHGGTLTASSEGPGKGATFELRLPLAKQAPAEITTPARHGRAALLDEKMRRRVLIVDDDRDSGQSLAMLLRLPGHEVRHTVDGADALGIAANFQPDVVLLDIGMPGMDGFEVVRRIRSQPGLAHLRVVALSGYGSEEDRRRSKEAGFDAHLVKPVDFDALRALLAALPTERGREASGGR